MLAMGWLHLVVPSAFARVVPDYMPAHLALAILSGMAEIAGGIGLQIPRFRRLAGWGLILLFVAVFPANVNMALHPGQFLRPALSWILWLRLPIQALLPFWAWRVSGPEPT